MEASLGRLASVDCNMVIIKIDIDNVMCLQKKKFVNDSLKITSSQRFEYLHEVWW